MTPVKLQHQKKEITKLDAKTLADICIRLAKYKTENKEFLNYLLFHSYDNQPYIDELKLEIANCFLHVNQNDYLYSKVLKGLLASLNKHLKFIGDKNREAEIVAEFCNTFMAHVTVRSYYAGLIQVLYRQFVRLQKVVGKLDEDLQFDYKDDIYTILAYLKKTRFYSEI
ncbi:MAG: hypothetical protein EAZ15_08740 [Sphingobacteriales bacterium]|nr:MAG: hypothetical protein EAZ15_08740 [Sphingobacteriales bacterium]